MEMSPTDVGVGALAMFVINGLLKLLYSRFNSKIETKVITILEQQTHILEDIRTVNAKNGEKLDGIRSNLELGLGRQTDIMRKIDSLGSK